MPYIPDGHGNMRHISWGDYLFNCDKVRRQWDEEALRPVELANPEHAVPVITKPVRRRLFDLPDEEYERLNRLTEESVGHNRHRDDEGYTNLEFMVTLRTNAPDDKLDAPGDPFSVAQRFLREVKLQFGSSVTVKVRRDDLWDGWAEIEPLDHASVE